MKHAVGGRRIRDFSRVRHMMAASLVTGAMVMAGAIDPTTHAASDSTSLDGSSWDLKVSPDLVAQEKGLKDFPETLSFAAGKISTATGQSQNFPSTSYSKTRSGENGWSFTAEQKSPTVGTYAWSGTASGDEVRGVLVWTKPDRSVLTFTFRGDRRNTK